MSPSSPDSVDQNYTSDCLNGKVVVPNNHADRATSIPMPAYHIRRTNSEAQLCEDMAVAEYRDRCMFNRLITGIRQRQAHQQRLHYETQQHQNLQNLEHLRRSQQQHQQQHQQKHPSRRVHSGLPTLPLNRNLHLPKMPKNVQVHAEKTIESIISTRCQSVQQHRGSPVLSIPHDKDTSTITPLDSYDERQRQCTGMAGQPCSPDPSRSDDWAIEGFEESPMPSPFTSPRTSQKQTLNFIPTHSDQLFDMDL